MRHLGGVTRSHVGQGLWKPFGYPCSRGRGELLGTRQCTHIAARFDAGCTHGVVGDRARQPWRGKSRDLASVWGCHALQMVGICHACLTHDKTVTCHHRHTCFRREASLKQACMGLPP